MQLKITKRKEEDMNKLKDKQQTVNKTCKSSPWIGFGITVTAILLTVNLNITKNTIKVYP